MKPFEIWSHSGLTHPRMPITLESISSVIDSGVDGIFLNARRCRSGELILLFDAMVPTDTDQKNIVQYIDLDDLRKMKCAEVNGVITLREAIEFIKGRLKIFVHLMSEDSESFESLGSILYELNQSGDLAPFSNCLIGSHNLPMLSVFKKKFPRIDVAAVLGHIPLGYLDDISALKSRKIWIHASCASELLIRDAHQRDIQVFVLSDYLQSKDVHFLRTNGVSGIAVQHADGFRKVG